jgi:methyl-accepting chemotaxis protein
MAIKEFITLEGVEEIETKLKRLNALGEDSLANFRNLGSAAGGTGDPFGKLVDGAKNAGLELQASSRHANTLREALHVLHPILQIAGARAGELGSFARLAGTGLAGLAIAAGGVVVVAFANLEEQIAKTKAALTGLLGSKDSANQAFGGLEKAAKGLNTSVEDLAPAFESATTALNRFKQTSGTAKFVALRPEDLPTGNVKDVTAAVENLFKVLRAGGQDSGEASKSAKVFFDTMKEGGKLTADALKQLDPGAVRLIAEAMGRGAISTEQFIAEVGLAPIPINKLIERLAKFSEGAQQAFDANAVKSFKDEFNALIRDTEKDFKDLFDISFSDFIINSLKDFSNDVKTIIADIRAAVAFVRSAAAPAGGAPVREAAIEARKPLEAVAPFKLSDLFGGNVKEDEKAITDALKTIQEDIKQTSEQIDQDIGGTIDMTTPEQSFQEGMNQIVAFAKSAAQSAFDAFQSIFSTPIKVTWDTSNSFLAQQPTSLASGGHVRGPGSSTSDSIMAWLSDFEYVINARAVRHYGTDLFGALNAMALPKDFMNRFAMGGLARSAGNRFASGGQVSSGNSVTLKIDRHTFNMTAGDDTVAAIKRFAVAAQISSTGRKPRFVR